MSDLFGNTCPCCGQPMPETIKASPFETFWQDVPHKVGKEAARKAWFKLAASDRQAAHARLKSWYSWFADKHPQASTPHPASYLNGKRWQDEVTSPKAILPRTHRLSKAAENIRSGKRFLCTQIPATMARECMAQGLVTEDQCREVGVI